MPLKYRQQSFEISGHKVSLRVLRDLTQFDNAHSHPGVSRDAFPLFGIVWTSSEVLAHYVSNHDHDSTEIGGGDASFNDATDATDATDAKRNGSWLFHSDPRILEVGCGMALTSHVLNAMGQAVSAMDIHPIAGDLIATNAGLNRLDPIPFFNASWSDPAVYLGEFDLIVGSDVLYEPRHAKHLAEFIDRHLSDEGRAIIVDPNRGQSEGFNEDMKRLGFNCRAHRPSFVDHLELPYSGEIYLFSRE